MKARVFPLFVLCGVLAGGALSAQAIEATAGVQANASVNPLPAAAAPTYSGGVEDVVKLAHSGVDESVVLSFIKNSQGPYNPSADEIIKLRDNGISPVVISAMLQRGAELRDHAVVGAPAQAAAPYDQTQQPAVAPDTSSMATPPLTPPDAYTDYGYAQPASTVVYVGGSYWTTSPIWVGGTFWPFFFPFPCWFNGCFFPHGCCFHNFHDFNHFCSSQVGFHGGFHGSISGFHGSAGFHSTGGFHSSAGFHSGTAWSGGHSGFASSGFHGGVAPGGFHGGMVSPSFHSGFVGGGFHGGSVGGGFHSFSGGGFHGGFSGGGFHGGSMGGGGFHGGGGGGGGGHR